MIDAQPGLIDEIRNRFHHVDSCPFEGERVFFENAGGALTLKSVVETSSKYEAIPDNQGRDNDASRALEKVIAEAKAAAMTFFNAPEGQVFVGESGTELLFRMISAAIMGGPKGGDVIGSTLEHPASSSAARKWAETAGKNYIAVPHDNEAGIVTAEDYAKLVTPETRVATIIHASPVTGMGVDIAAISAAVRAVAPDCVIIIDGIQHAAHGRIDLTAAKVDGYAVSPYKVFSRHGYGLAWISDRLSRTPHNSLIGGPETNWELGTRDTSAYATFLEVVRYFEWLGGRFTDAADPRAKIEAAGQAIHAQEKALTDAMLYGVGNLKGLSEMPGVTIIGGVDNPHREGLVSFTVSGSEAPEIVAQLRQRRIRVHARKADHYSGGVLKPLGLTTCVRTSVCHYNTTEEVAQFLAAMQEISGAA